MAGEKRICRTLVARTEEETCTIASRVANVLPTDTIVVLTGPLGAGKTRFVKAFASAYGIPHEDVVSPTFVLCRHYHGTHAITHMDVYRIGDIEEFQSLGPEDLFAREGITFIEWGERVSDVLPDKRLQLTIKVATDGSREFTFETEAAGLSEALQRL